MKTFVPVNGNRVWTGRLVGFADGVVRIDLAAVKQKGKGKKAAAAEIVGGGVEGCGEGEFGGGDLVLGLSARASARSRFLRCAAG